MKRASAGSNEWARQARRQRGGNAPSIFVFAPPPNLFLAPHGIFWGGKSCWFWLEKMFEFVISARKSLPISAKPFFLYST